ncbi:nuclear export chaperone [Schizosaccharomyces pombe]|uniref:Protein bcp1 n=1 Tax=Schizosaccharomyces pombe (strain 972 / ATCC 24843) TaxID=284812 RepID=BCP1_SCHPO|nr:putative cyclin-dependent kinase regulator [Schizosaccharomyces pombe]O74907.2 RecName: Full=Protein bcp1 [Schizosaccharomyces pombe 972h-]CAA21060.2 CDK regulator, involved in ribosome export (predicted) [Schizosaccharomyces pombe]|eukprot:NP_587696.2 putative cyclin-dependent kinase regulator [Schizosaccharomyces pombe]
MAKRHAEENEDTVMSESLKVVDTDFINVDFEFFDPQPIDFHAFKNLLKQLLGYDHTNVNLSALADLILSQPLLGSTVKVDGNNSDPYAMLSVINLNTRRDEPVIKQLTSYIISRLAKSNSRLENELQKLLEPNSGSQVGLIVNERLINMPVQVIPPMYNMLLEEMQWAINENEPYNFTHYLLLSRTYTEIESKLMDDERPSKKGKKSKKTSGEEVMFFHPEDEQFREVAIDIADYPFANQDFNPDANRVFQDAGIKPQGELLLMTNEDFKNLVPKLMEIYSA